MTNTLTPPIVKPPVDAELTGPISSQPIGAISQQVTATGESGTPAPGPSGLGITPAGTTTAAYTGGPVAAPSAGGGVSPALAQQIATAISVGLAQAPTSAAGWAQLADYYSTSAGQNQIETAEQTAQTPAPIAPTPSTTPTSVAGGAATSGNVGPQQVAAQIAKAGGSALQQQVGASLVTGIESDGSPTELAGGIGPAEGLFQFEPGTWTGNGGGKNGIPSSVGAATWQQQVQVFVNATKGDNFGAWGPDLGANYGYTGAPMPGSKVANAISQLGSSIVNAPFSQTAAAGAPGSSSNIAKIAASQIGVPYVWGGEDPNSPGTKGAFDCSGLVQWVYGQAGTALPRVAQAQYNATPKVANNQQLQPGDLLFFGSGPNGIEHVGIYVGNNQMIDAPHTGADVRIDENPTSWGNYVGATRPVDPTGATTASTGPAAATASNSQQQFSQILQQVTQSLGQLSGQYPGMFNQTQAVLP